MFLTRTMVLFVSQLLLFAFSAATLDEILAVPDKAVPFSSKIVASFLVKYFGSHIHTRKVKHISLVTQFDSDGRLIHDIYISHLLHSLQAEFSYRFLNNLRWQSEFIGASVVVFLVADYDEWR